MRVIVPDETYAATLRAAVPDVDCLVWHIDAPDSPPDAEMLVTARPLDATHQPRITQIPSLRWLQLLSLGFDWIVDRLPAQVTAMNARGCVEESTAEHALALTIAGLRQYDAAFEQAAAHHWQTLWTRSLRTARVLLLGYGGLGKAIIRRLEAFDVAELTVVARTARTSAETGRSVHAISELDALLPAHDVLLLAIPLTHDTQGLIDARHLNLLPDDSLVVNVGRGGLIDTADLLAELEQGRLRAALDVVDPEPLPVEHPLWAAPGVFITPHIGGNTDDFLHATRQLVAAQVQAIIDRQTPANIILTHE